MSPEIRPPADRGPISPLVAGHALVAIVCAIGVCEGANDCEFVGHLREAREEFTDFDSGDIGADRPELAADLGGCVGLEVEHVEMRRSARKVDVDDCLVRGARPGPRFHP